MNPMMIFKNIKPKNTKKTQKPKNTKKKRKQCFFLFDTQKKLNQIHTALLVVSLVI